MITSATIGSLTGLLAYAKRNKTLRSQEPQRTFDPGFSTYMGYGAGKSILIWTEKLRSCTLDLKVELHCIKPSSSIL
ncbi:hypothetical protein J2S17_001629 [Cytobacillus purgationiresistens]|uniref:Uncharacterized protein n=1 Tax=Cytobacillus purgationiresistens TaxID=863449 RepID=A0ABU0AES7_9BACI|nr:hypothetical protein [Cytobacillus purgationiresistens]